ncbi:MAG: hypothetical protein AAF664_11110 [Planctomycetota bacterium]
MSSHRQDINPYASPDANLSPVSAGGVPTRVVPVWISVVWDASLLAIFVYFLPSMIEATERLFERSPLSLQTISKLPERWMIAFFLLSWSVYFSVKRHCFWRLVYGIFALSFLFQHFPAGWLNDLIMAAIFVFAFLPIFTHGVGWLGVARSIILWIKSSLMAKRDRRLQNVAESQSIKGS